MLALPADCVGATNGQALGAAAVTVAKVLPREGLIEWFGQDTLVRRIAGVLAAAADSAQAAADRGGVDLCAVAADGSGVLKPAYAPQAG